MLETKPSDKPLNTNTLAIAGAIMLLLTFVAGILVGYYFFEAHIVNRLNTQFEGMGLGLCNTTTTYIQTNEQAWLTYLDKNQTPFIGWKGKRRT